MELSGSRDFLWCAGAIFSSFPKAAHLGKAGVCLPAFSQLPDKDVGLTEKLCFKAVNFSSKAVAVR